MLPLCALKTCEHFILVCLEWIVRYQHAGIFLNFDNLGLQHWRVLSSCAQHDHGSVQDDPCFPLLAVLLDHKKQLLQCTIHHYTCPIMKPVFALLIAFCAVYVQLSDARVLADASQADYYVRIWARDTTSAQQKNDTPSNKQELVAKGSSPSDPPVSQQPPPISQQRAPSALKLEASITQTNPCQEIQSSLEPEVENPSNSNTKLGSGYWVKRYILKHLIKKMAENHGWLED